MPDEPVVKGPLPAGVVAGIIIAFFAMALGLILHSKSQQKMRDAQATAMEQELNADKAALDAQKEKVVQLTQQLDALKQKFNLGLISDADKPKAAAQYHELVQQQHAERDKYVPMADAYNAKIEKLQELKQ